MSKEKREPGGTGEGEGWEGNEVAGEGVGRQTGWKMRKHGLELRNE
jgi:hypothetical protein